MNTQRISIILTMAVFLAVPAHADLIITILSPSTLAGLPGATLTFQGTLSNDAGMDLHINGAGLNLAGLGPNDSDLTDFLFNAPVVLANGASTMPFAFFTVTIPKPFAAGDYLGSFVVQGGPGASDDNVLGTVTLDVRVNAAAGTPEPGSLCLTVVVLGVIAIKTGRKRSV